MLRVKRLIDFGRCQRERELVSLNPGPGVSALGFLF